MKEFVDSQSPNGAWATYLDLTLLAELVGANFAVKMSGGSEHPTILSAAPREDKPTITLDNTHNTHWSAQIDGTKKSARGDGNCGYNAFALSLATLAPQKPIFSSSLREEATGDTISAAAKIIRHEEEIRLKSSIQAAQQAEKQYEHAMQTIQQQSPDQFDKI